MTNTSLPASILIVEDDAITREILADYLHQAGFHVRESSSGEDALRQLQTDGRAIDWLFTDINLSGPVDGWLVGSEFRLSHPFRPIVFATAALGVTDRAVMNSIFFQKPYRPAEVVDAFRTLCASLDNMNRDATAAMRREAVLHTC